MGGDDSPTRTLPDDEELALSSDSGGATPDADALFRALSNATRRRTLWYLLEESPASLHELADVLAGWRLDDQSTVDPDDHETLVAALHHSHLPFLDDAGLADYDREDATAEATALAPVVEDTVRFAQAYDAARPAQR